MAHSRFRLAAALACGATLAFPLSAYAADSVTGTIMGSDGADHGTVQVTAAPRGVILRIQAKGLAPGWHGTHFHEKGDCTPPKFASAGAHVHATMPMVHGLLNDKANDAGDLPNIYVNADGTATVELYSTMVSLKPDDSARVPLLRTADGASLVIHANPDDYLTQPIGGSGDRVACAVLR
jgi:superoxide dismutase, Cu-Zn family